jgi:polysaccharide biosynthesis/export protein
MSLIRSRNFSLQRILPLLTFAITATAAFGQVQKQIENSQPNPVDNNLPIQKIGPDDLLQVQVYDSPELTRSVRVSPDGNIQLPMMTKPVRAQGYYPNDLEKILAHNLQEEGILVRPIVTVTVSEYRSRPITVVGAVKKPVTFQAYGNMRLLDAISQADGLSDTAGGNILVSKPGPDGGSLVQRIPLRLLLSGEDPSMNVVLEAGDEVRVSEAGRVYVVGNVKKPGSIQVHETEDLTVMRALAEAQGLADYSSNWAYILRQGEKSGDIPVPLNKIMTRKAPDVPLQTNDVLFVPENKGKRVMAKAAEVLTGFGIGTVSGLLIWRH